MLAGCSEEESETRVSEDPALLRRSNAADRDGRRRPCPASRPLALPAATGSPRSSAGRPSRRGLGRTGVSVRCCLAAATGGARGERLPRHPRGLAWPTQTLSRRTPDLSSPLSADPYPERFLQP